MSPQVYLDVKYASDPKIEFPIVILPALQGPDGEHLPAYPTDGIQSIWEEWGRDKGFLFF